MIKRYPDSAFPHIVRMEGPCDNPYTGQFIAAGEVEVEVDHGLTVRDYFAAEAMKIVGWASENLDSSAANCYLVADAMMKARQK